MSLVYIQIFAINDIGKVRVKNEDAFCMFHEYGGIDNITVLIVKHLKIN